MSAQLVCLSVCVALVMHCGCQRSASARSAVLEYVARVAEEARASGPAAAEVVRAHGAGSLITLSFPPTPVSTMYALIRNNEGGTVTGEMHHYADGRLVGPPRRLYRIPGAGSVFENLYAQVARGETHRPEALTVWDAGRAYHVVTGKSWSVSFDCEGRCARVFRELEALEWTDEEEQRSAALQQLGIAITSPRTFPSFATYVDHAICAFDDACILVYQASGGDVPSQ